MQDKTVMDTTTTLFHGSKSAIDTFQHQQHYTNGRNNGFGFYFTSDINRAMTYGENGYVYEIDTKKFAGLKELNSRELTLSTEALTDYIDYISQEQIKNEEYPYLLSDYGYDIDESEFENINDYCQELAQSMMTSAVEYKETDVELINDLNNVLGDASLSGKALTSIGVGYSIDSSLDKNNPDVIVFDPDNIKIKNSCPTKQLLMAKQKNITNAISR